jgi:hypothetical protein
LTTVILFFLLGTVGCCFAGGPGGGNGGGSNRSIESSGGSRLSEEEAIGAVKALLKAESRTHKENREELVTTMCSSQRAEYDTRCEPCAPGSPNFCIKELKTVLVEVPSRCAFPPSEQAQ